MWKCKVSQMLGQGMQIEMPPSYSSLFCATLSAKLATTALDSAYENTSV